MFLSYINTLFSRVRNSHRRSRLRDAQSASVCHAVGKLEDRVLLMTQSIAPTTAAISAQPGQQFQFSVSYNSTNNGSDVTTNAFALRMFFDSSQLRFDGYQANSVLATNRQFPAAGADVTNPSITTVPDTTNLDATSNPNNSTDNYSFVSWAEPSGNFAANATLYTALFTPTAAFSGTSTIHFNAIPADGFTFNGTDVVVTAAAANSNPTITSSGTASAAENQTGVTTVVANDTDGDSLTYTLTGPDAALFSISGSGVVTFNSAPDFESPADVGADNVYNVTANVSDGNGGSANQPLTITVTNVNESPTITSSAAVSVAENQTAAIDVNATDADNDTLTYAISGGADQSQFSINSTTGVVTFITAPDFENPADSDTGNDYNFTVSVTDGNGGSASQNVTVNVTNVNENSSPVITSSATAAVAENQTAAIDVNATDADNDTLTYAISGGADAALFNINSTTGVVTFNTVPDFENPADSDTGNDYNFTVSVTDGNGGSASQNVTVNVTNVNENSSPVITSSATAAVAENQTAAIDVNATDADNDTLTYAISGGADAALFSINSTTGVVTFITAPDFENPTDAGANNVYNIQVTANDGTVNSTPQNVVISVTDVNDTSPGTGIIQGRKWNDLNGDGQRTPNEPFLNGWSIQLVNSAGVVIDTQTTADRNGQAGWYQFDAPAGTYTLREVRQDGWIQTAPFDDLAVRASTVDSQLNLRATQNEFLDWGGRDEKWLLGSSGWHFITPDGTLYQWDNSPRNALTGTTVDTFSSTYYQNTALLHSAAVANAPTYTVTAGQTHPNVLFGNQNVSQPGTVRGRKWHDLNGDGQRTADEPWLNGWTIELVNGPGAISQSVTTADVDLDGNGTIDPETERGWYQFDSVPAGQWIVREQLQSGWIQTSTSDVTELEAWQLDQDLNLQFHRSLFTNWGGLNERWVRGDDAWYYITPDGEFFRWNNSPRTNLTGTKVATLSPEYHADPARLYDARNPFETPVVVAPGATTDGVHFGNQESSVSVPSDFDGQGNVTAGVFGRHLIISGDNSGNGVVVHTNTDGHVTVTPLGNTTVNGESLPWTVNTWTAVPGDVRVNLHGGNDAIVVRDLRIGLDLEVNTGSGSDYS